HPAPPHHGHIDDVGDHRTLRIDAVPRGVSLIGPPARKPTMLPQVVNRDPHVAARRHLAAILLADGQLEKRMRAPNPRPITQTRLRLRIVEPGFERPDMMGDRTALDVE